MKNRSRATLAPLIIATVTLGGCGLATVPLYEGPARAIQDVATISGVAIYPERHADVITWKIDGNLVDHMRTAEFLVPPGLHTIQVFVRKDYRLEFTGMGFQSEWSEAYIDIPLSAAAGHTYIADIDVDGKTVHGRFFDAGLNFNPECMPLRRFAVAYGGSRDGRRVGCEDRP